MTRGRSGLQIALLALLGGFLLGDACNGPAPPTSTAPLASTTAFGSTFPRVVPDADGDFVSDYCDNCRLAENRSQLDSDAPDACVILPGEASGVCRDKSTQACTSHADCQVVRGNFCDCDVDGNGVCNIDDFNAFLADRAAGGESPGRGTDFNGDGVVDDLDFPIFQAGFAAGAPGEGAQPAKPVDGSCNPDTDPTCTDGYRPGSCFEHRIGRFFEGSQRPWRIHDGSDGCSLDGQLVVDAGLPAAATNLNNPTDALLSDRSGGVVRCPNAAFGSFPSGYVCDTTVSCDPRDRGKPCGSENGRGGIVECGNVDVGARACELFDVCESQCGYRSFDCAEQYRQNLFETCLALTGSEREQCLPTCLQLAELYAGATGDTEDPGDWTASDLEQEAALCKCCPDAGPDGAPPAACGDGVCSPETESCHPSSCPEDCGSCALGTRCLTDDDCGAGACSFRGLCEVLPAGATCSDASECRTGVCTTGVCAASCGDGFCEGSETCGTNGANACPGDCGACSVGAPCSVPEDCLSESCADGLCAGLATLASCSGDGACQSSLCDLGACAAAPKPAGESCGDDRACAGGLCDLGQCVAEPKPPGSACGRHEACEKVVEVDRDLPPIGVCNLGECLPAGQGVDIGGACDNDLACNDREILGVNVPSVCNLGTCIQSGTIPIGEACDAEKACADAGACASGLCKATFFSSVVCSSGSECASGVCDPLGKCFAICGDGLCEPFPAERCGEDDLSACRSDCGQCLPLLPGQLGFGCIANDQCASGICNFGLCLAGPNGPNTICSGDASCWSGICNFGFCTAETTGIGTPCTSNSKCESFACNFGFCVASRSLENDHPCTTGRACQSGVCNFGFCTDPLPNDSVCSASVNCQSSVCNLGICFPQRAVPTGLPCTANLSCTSGVCGGIPVLDELNDYVTAGLLPLPGTCKEVCGDLVCEGLETCGYGNLLTNCLEDCGLCPNGDPCLGNFDCESGACNFPICVAAASVPTGLPCTTSKACVSGRCLAGICAPVCGDDVCDVPAELCGSVDSGLECTSDCGKCPNGTPCASNAVCASGVCNFPICIAAGSVATGGLCTTNGACASGSCVAGLCVPVCGDDICDSPAELCGAVNSGLECNSDCGKCPNGTACASNAVCESGVCNFPICIAAGSVATGGTCTTSLACRSGSCVAGFCVQVCGDGFCDGAELCGSANSGLQCNADCGRCANGTLCTSNAVCSSGVCNFGICIAGNLSNGSPCSTSAACSSDLCIAGFCTSCLPFTAGCSSNAQCCSGNCSTDILGNRSCGL